MHPNPSRPSCAAGAILVLTLSGQPFAAASDDVGDSEVAASIGALDLSAALSIRPPAAGDAWSRPWTASLVVAERPGDFDLDDAARLDLRLGAFEDEGEGGHGEWESRPNRVGFFVGATTKGGHTGFTLGLEYERRLSDLIGVGVVGEWTPDGREFVGAVSAFFHPVGALVLSVGPGLSVEDSDTHFLVRFGIGYEFELSHGLSLAPVVSYDLTEGEDDAVVYGLLVSFLF